MEHLSKDDVVWLLGDYAQVRQLGRVSKHMGAHLKAMSLLKNKTIHKPSCSCEYSAYAKMASSMWEQHKSALVDKLASYDKPRGRGKK